VAIGIAAVTRQSPLSQINNPQLNRNRTQSAIANLNPHSPIDQTRNRQPQSALANRPNPQSPTSIRTRQSTKSAIAIPQSAILG
jgi:hypothetical protein